MTRSTPILLALTVTAAAAPLVACGSGASGPSMPQGNTVAAAPSGSSTSSAPPASSSPSGTDAGSAPAPASGGGVGQWSMRLGGPQADIGTAVATDKAGDVVVVGTCQGTATVGGTPFTSAGEIDFFVAKYDNGGYVSWVRPFGGTGNDAATSVALDDNGNVYVAGASDGALTLGGSSFGQGSATGAFMLMLDPFGNVTGAAAYGGGAYGTTVGIAVASDGSIGLCGSYTGQINLGGGPLTAAQGTYAGFVALFDSTNTLTYAQPLGTSATATAQAVSFGASDGLAVVGTFTGTGQFGSATLTSAGDSDVFVSTFDGMGNSLTSHSFGGPGQDDGLATVFDSSGNLLVVGDFSDTVDFGQGPVTSQGSLDAFVMKLSAAGTSTWSQTFGGPSVDSAESVAVDAAGEPLVSGEFEETMTVGTATYTSAGDKDIFLEKLGSSGSMVWGKRFGSLEADEGIGAGFDAQGNALVTGYFRTQVDFGTGMQTSAGDDDVFVAAYGP
jgi:hypothetical protein